MKVLAFLTRFKHHRPDGGYKQLIAELTAHHQVEFQEWGNDETHATFPNGTVERLQSSYKWLAEWRAFLATRGNGMDVAHIMYAEEYFRFSHRLFPHVPLVATFHQPADLLEQELVEGGHGGRVAKWTHHWNKHRFSRLSGAIVTHPDQRIALSRVMPLERIHVIPLGVSLPQITTENINAPRSGFLTLGNWFRDWEMYEQVVTRMPEETFHLVNRQLPLDVAQRLMPFPNVHYHRDLSDTELTSLMLRSSVAFLPLLKLAGSNALLECLSAGLPVVVSNVNTAEDATFPARCMARFQATNPEDAIHHLHAFKTSISVADRMHCVEIAKTFSWPSVAKNTYELYKSLI